MLTQLTPSCLHKITVHVVMSSSHVSLFLKRLFRVYLSELKFLAIWKIRILHAVQECTSCDTTKSYFWMTHVSFLSWSSKRENLLEWKSWSSQLSLFWFETYWPKKAVSTWTYRRKSGHYLAALMTHTSNVFPVLSIFPTQFSNMKRSKSDLSCTLTVTSQFPKNPSRQILNFYGIKKKLIWQIRDYYAKSTRVMQKSPKCQQILPHRVFPCVNISHSNSHFTLSTF